MEILGFTDADYIFVKIYIPITSELILSLLTL